MSIAHLLTLACLSVAACAQPPDEVVAHWRLQAELRVGGSEAGPAYEFTELSQVVATANAVLVRQSAYQELRVFDLAGIYQRTIGRAGGGPGEFKGMWAFGVYGDTVWTLDFALRRVSLFLTSGELLTTVTFEAVTPTLGENGNLFATYPMARQRDGVLLGFGGTSGQAMAAGRVRAMPILRMSPAGLTSDTLGWLPVTHSNMILKSSVGTSYHDQPFNDSPLPEYAANQQRVYVIDRYAASNGTASYGVVAIGSDGDTAWVRSYPYLPLPMDRAVADSVQKRMYRMYGVRYPQSMIDDSLYIPKFQPPVSEATAGEDGTLWLRREKWAPTTKFDVLDAKGQLLAQVEAGRSVRIRWVSGTTAWGQELDENDVPALVRYRIIKEGVR
ncbi:MAG: 6-bladed beta-propeller [Gemmatimonadaceae bacterium]|nr:6-bladed beta-propeller [Gemmatimonadaceae bacterium]